MHSGEAEAIALAMEEGSTRLLLDEHRARVIAKRMGIQTLGCIGILLQGKKEGLVQAILPLLDKLENQAGFWIDHRLRALALARAGE